MIKLNMIKLNMIKLNMIKLSAHPFLARNEVAVNLLTDREI